MNDIQDARVLSKTQHFTPGAIRYFLSSRVLSPVPHEPLSLPPRPILRTPTSLTRRRGWKRLRFDLARSCGGQATEFSDLSEHITRRGLSIGPAVLSEKRSDQRG